VGRSHVKKREVNAPKVGWRTVGGSDDALLHPYAGGGGSKLRRVRTMGTTGDMKTSANKGKTKALERVNIKAERA